MRKALNHLMSDIDRIVKSDTKCILLKFHSLQEKNSGESLWLHLTLLTLRGKKASQYATLHRSIISFEKLCKSLFKVGGFFERHKNIFMWKHQNSSISLNFSSIGRFIWVFSFTHLINSSSTLRLKFLFFKW